MQRKSVTVTRIEYHLTQAEVERAIRKYLIHEHGASFIEGTVVEVFNITPVSSDRVEQYAVMVATNFEDRRPGGSEPPP